MCLPLPHRCFDQPLRQMLAGLVLSLLAASLAACTPPPFSANNGAANDTAANDDPSRDSSGGNDAVGIEGRAGTKHRDSAAESTFSLGGIQVHEASLDGWFDNLAHAGMNTVAVTDYARQGEWDTASLRWDPNPEVLAEIRGAKARGMRVVLVLRVHLEEDFPRNRFLWHGMIMPQGDDQVREWFARYETFVRHWAEIAEREGIDTLMIGSELNALASTLPIETVPDLEAWFLDESKQAERRDRTVDLVDSVPAEHLWRDGEEGTFGDVGSYLDARIAAERDWAAAQIVNDPAIAVARQNARRTLLETHWLALIESVRGVYSGQLGYAANFDQYMKISFWNRLDIIGINAYFKLRDYLIPDDDPDALAVAVEQGWRKVLGEIEAFRAAIGLDQPVMFTEMGFTTRRNSTIETWADTGFAHVRRARDADAGDTRLVIWREQPVDLSERAIAVAALERVRREANFPLTGILWWKLSSHAYHQPHEAFLLLLDPAFPDPVLPILRRFVTTDGS